MANNVVPMKPVPVGGAKEKLTISEWVVKHRALCIILGIVAVLLVAWGITTGVTNVGSHDVYNITATVNIETADPSRRPFLRQVADVNAKLQGWLEDGDADAIVAAYVTIRDTDLPDGGLTHLKAAELDALIAHYRAAKGELPRSAVTEANKKLSARLRF